MLIALVLLITELLTPEVVMFLALCIVWNVGIINNKQALEGFSNDSLVVVGAMFMVVKGVDRSKLIDRTARSTLGAKTTQVMSLLRLICITLFFGCFINNAPLVALFMPIIRDWARVREFAASKFLMPLSFASIGGGSLTLIGTSTNLVINGMMQEDTGEAFGFFDPARVGLLQNFFTMLYMLTMGVRLLPEEKGGLFRTLKERKDDMVTELQVQPSFPLVGTSASEVMDALGVPRAALLKIFRQPVRRGFSRLTSPAGQRQGGLQRAISEDNGSHAARRAPSGLMRFKSSPDLVPGGPSYMERTAHCWGTPKRSRTLTDSQAAGPLRVETGAETVSVDDPEVREIFPVPEQEVVLAGDVLLLSLPRDSCVAFVDSERVAKLLHSLAEEPSQKRAAGAIAGSPPEQVGLRMRDMDLLEIPGRQGEFVELVLSQANPFVGVDFSGAGRHDFEDHYQVAVLAVRQSTWTTAAEETAKGDVLLSYDYHKKTTALQEDEDLEDELGSPHGRSPTESSEVSGAQAGAACTGAGLFQSQSAPRVEDDMKSSERVPQRMRAGDTVLVLTKAATGEGKRFPVQEFLAETTVAHEPMFEPTVFDYIPLGLFIIGIVLVASQQVTMVQVSMTLAVIFMVCGWVSPKELRENIDWNMLVLIGSALGLAKAVQVSGLSGAVASVVKNAKMGKRATVFALYFFTMVVTELVTNNAAAALAYPLAADLTRELGLTSVKPLAMTAMLGTSACYVNPIGTACNLMIMGPGGYTFKDFVKVGFLMDVICWINAGIFVPIFFPMEFVEPQSD